MAQEITVEKFKRLRNKLKKIAPKIAELEGIRKTKKAQNQIKKHKRQRSFLSAIKATQRCPIPLLQQAHP